MDEELNQCLNSIPGSVAQLEGQTPYYVCVSLTQIIEAANSIQVRQVRLVAISEFRGGTDLSKFEYSSSQPHPAKDTCMQSWSAHA